MATRKTSARRIAEAERKARALRLRAAGLTFQQIADCLVDTDNPSRGTLYASKQSAYRAIRGALDEIVSAPAEELRALESARLDDLHVELWPSTRAVQAVTAMCDCGSEVVMYREPDMRAVSQVLRVAERRAALLGLDHRHQADERMFQLLEQQAEEHLAIMHKAMLGGLERAAIDADKQREVMTHVVALLREAEDLEDATMPSQRAICR